MMTNRIRKVHTRKARLAKAKRNEATQKQRQNAAINRRIKA